MENERKPMTRAQVEQIQKPRPVWIEWIGLHQLQKSPGWEIATHVHAGRLCIKGERDKDGYLLDLYGVYWVAYVRQAGNGCFVLCQEAEAAGIAHNGTVYHLLGREALEGAESVILEKTDAGDLVKRIQDTAKDVDAMNVDQELRLTLLEMGISSTDAQAF